MTINPINPPGLPVHMPHELQDQLQNVLSRRDFITAMDEIFLRLPRLHSAVAVHRSGRKPPHDLRCFQARLAWVDLGFTYVQLGPVLHIVQLWTDTEWDKPTRHKVDVVLGEVAAPGTRP